MKEALFGKTLTEIDHITAELGMPRYASRQITSWLYKKNVSSIEEMTDLSRKSRADLAEKYEVGVKLPESEVISTDGTAKYLFSVSETRFVETAYIPETDRATVCVSSQSGCRYGCLFCMTGKQGFQGNLSAGEIINQFRSIPGHTNLTNIVYMGMGEPLDNLDNVLKSLSIMTSDWGYAWSPRRITVSTVGVMAGMSRLLEETEAHIAVSLHTPFEKERADLMPVQKANPVKEIIKLLKSYDLSGQRRVSFEYIVFKGRNDSPSHISELARILNGLRCRINLIRYHRIPGTDLESPPYEEVARFRDALTAKGIITTIRASRGEDIMAACGLLSTKEQNLKG